MSTLPRPLEALQSIHDDRSKKSFESMDCYSPSDPTAAYCTPSSSFSDLSTPMTPNFSTRVHSRLPSSTSSLETNIPPFSNSISDSPIVTAQVEVMRSPKRPLPNVEEEHEDYDMFDDTSGVQTCSNYDHDHSLCAQMDTTDPSLFLPAGLSDYDFAESFATHGHPQYIPKAKKRRSGESSFSGMASRFGHRFPSLRRRWKSPMIQPATSTVDLTRDITPSRAASTRSPSLYRPDFDEMFKYPPTPTSEIVEQDEQIDLMQLLDVDDEQLENPERAHSRDGLATTPLLPPLMVPESIPDAQTFQSPLQSPSICPEVTNSFTSTNTPIATPDLAGVPSPPMSIQPSARSFDATSPSSTGLVPSSEIPPIHISEPSSTWEKSWATRLGHANFTPLPEPYFPTDCESLRIVEQLKNDYEAARTSYTRHLMRAGEHYGTTSTTYQLSEQKWTEIDAHWGEALDACSGLVETESPATVNMHIPHSSTKVGGGDLVHSSRPATKVPSLADPRGLGKFPTLGDGEVVGPMVRYTSTLQRKTSRRSAFLKFLQDVKFPANILRRREERT